MNVTITAFGGIDVRDYPDFVDAFAEAAYYTETGMFLLEEELDRLNDEFPDIVQAQALEYMSGE